MAVPREDDWRTSGGERDSRGQNHTAETHVHKKGSMLISSEEQGMISSNLVITSGWRTPSFPTLWPLTKISAHRPGKKAGPAKQSEKNQCFSWQKCQWTFNTKSSPVYFKNDDSSLNHWVGNESASSHFLALRTGICYHTPELPQGKLRGDEDARALRCLSQGPGGRGMQEGKLTGAVSGSLGKAVPRRWTGPKQTKGKMKCKTNDLAWEEPVLKQVFPK